jgi:hypothetical protein
MKVSSRPDSGQPTFAQLARRLLSLFFRPAIKRDWIYERTIGSHWDLLPEWAQRRDNWDSIALTRYCLLTGDRQVCALASHCLSVRGGEWGITAGRLWFHASAFQRIFLFTGTPESLHAARRAREERQQAADAVLAEIKAGWSEVDAEMRRLG